jgi:hypothetical protein
MHNAYESSAGTFRYIQSAGAPRYQLNINSNTHAWYTAPSGTAGNPITFTQAMTLSSANNLGIGTTSPSWRIDAESAVTGAYTTSTAQVVASLTNQPASLGSGVNSAFLRFKTTPDAGASNPIVHIGAVAESYGSNDASFVIQTRDASGVIEKVRVTSAGNLLVGTTSTSVTSGGLTFQPASGQSYGDWGHVTGTGSGSYYLALRYAGTIIGGITQSGTTAVIYNTTSDYRLKNVIGAVTGHGERLDALEPIEYEWKSDGSRTRGFLAHKFQEIYADSVTGTKDAVDEEGNPKYQGMQASSSEVIADLVAEIQSLRQRLSAANL